MKAPALFMRVAERWTNLPAAERNRALLAAALLALGAYAGFHAFVTMPELIKARGDLTRLQGRARNLDRVPAAASKPRASRRLPVQLQQDLAALEAELAAQRTRLATLQGRFARLDHLADHQAQRLALTELANAADIEVIKLESKGVRREDQRLAPTPERLKAMAEHNVFRRPLLRLEARASYRGLMEFLDGLAGLPHVVSPVWLRIDVKTDATDTTPATRQWLELAVDLAL